MNVEEADRLDFDEAMLPEDSWERTLDEDEFEAEKIMDVRSGRKAFLEGSNARVGTMEGV